MTVRTFGPIAHGEALEKQQQRAGRQRGLQPVDRKALKAWSVNKGDENGAKDGDLVSVVAPFPSFSGAECTAYRAIVAANADDLHRDDCVSDATWAMLARRWSDAELVELLALPVRSGGEGTRLGGRSTRGAEDLRGEVWIGSRQGPQAIRAQSGLVRRYQSEIAVVRDALAREDRPHLREYLGAWDDNT